MIDLRKELDAMLQEYGLYVLLHRTSRKIRCKCWDEIHHEADVNCTRCLGKGWVSRIERHLTRYNAAIQMETKPNLNQALQPGRSYVDAMNFYFRHDVHPKSGDYIYIVGWDKKNPQKPTHLMRAYIINDVYAARGDKGRIEYYLVSVKAETIKTKIKNIVVRSLGPLKNYEIEY